MTTPLTNKEFGDLFDSFGQSAFRLESLDRYTVPAEAVEYRRFLVGELFPVSAEDEWAQLIRKNVHQGKIMQRVHVISMPLTPYLRYEIEWGYVYSSLAGEDIYLIERADVPREILRIPEFWLFDRKTLIVMHYDPIGHFVNAERNDSPEAIAACCQASASLLASATQLKQFLARIRTA
jgi:hypothetical protein